MIRRQVLPIVVPAAVVGGYIILGNAGGWLEAAWEDFLGPFLLTYWLGLGFTIAWDVAAAELRLENASPTVITVTGILGTVFLLMVIGGPNTLVEEPWLVGVAVAPALRLVAPWLDQAREGKAPTEP